MKNQSTFILIFWIYSSRSKNNKVPIYARITVEGNRANFSLKRRILAENWEASRGMMKGTRQESKLVNKYLDQVRSNIYSAYEELLSEHKMITAQTIKNRYLGKDLFYRSFNSLVISSFKYHLF